VTDIGALLFITNIFHQYSSSLATFVSQIAHTMSSAPPEGAGPSTAKKGRKGAQWLVMEEVVLFFACLAANEAVQSQNTREREARTKEFYIAYIKQIDELGLWVPGRSGTQQAKTVEDSIQMRTGANAPSLLNRFTTLNTSFYKVRNQMAKVQQASGYKPPSGNNNIYTYWHDSASDAVALLDDKDRPYLEHFSYVCPTSWRLDESLKAPAEGRDECSFSGAAKEWFEKKVRKDLNIDPNKRDPSNVTQKQLRAPNAPPSADPPAMRADTGNDDVRIHALTLAYSTQVSAWNSESDREESRWQMRWKYAKEHGLPSPPPPVHRPPPEMPHHLRDVYAQIPPSSTAPVASEPEGTRQASRTPPHGESPPSPISAGDASGDPVANTPLPDGGTSPVVISPNAQTPTPPDDGDDDDECEDSPPSPAALAAAARRRVSPERDASPPEPAGWRPLRFLRTRPPLPNDAFRQPIRQRLNDADGEPVRRASTRATQKPSRLVSG